jgi:hypothetical protein
MNVSFAPLAPDAVDFLTQETGIEFRHIDFANPHWFCVTARRDDGTLMGVAIGEFKTWFDCHFSTAICDPHCLSRKLLRVIFQTIFQRAVRITALVSPDHLSAVDQTRRMGFVYEGFLRLGVEGNRDALIYGMLREDCRFLPDYHPARASVPPISLGGYHGLLS